MPCVEGCTEPALKVISMRHSLLPTWNRTLSLFETMSDVSSNDSGEHHSVGREPDT